MAHRLVYQGVEGKEARFGCADCGWVIGFPLLGDGEPAATPYGEVWLPPAEGTYGEPPCGEEPPPPREPIPREEFVQRFTDPELAGLLASQDLGVKTMLYRAQTRDVVHLDSPTVTEGLAYLVAKGLLTAERAQEIQA